MPTPATPATPPAEAPGTRATAAGAPAAAASGAPVADSLYPYTGRFPVYGTLPERGVDRAALLAMVRQMAAEEDRKGDLGRVSGSIYSGDHDHYHFLAQAFEAFAHANVLQRDMYPSATKMESEIIAMTASLLHGDEDTNGLMTSGGTESLQTAMLVYREWARETKGITNPQVIMPVTGHPGTGKAFHYFGIEWVPAPVGDDQRCDVDFVADHIGPDTIAISGSAGTYPHGVIDPIGELGELAQRHGIGLHVDGCLGGFILPFATELGHPVEPFDFAVPGVTSISADTHKYGYAFKGTSVVLFRPKALRRHQYLVFDSWPGGAYASPGMGGSRSGGLLAATWAAMVNLGREGYRRIAADIFATADRIRDAVLAQPELHLVGDSVFNIAFGSDLLDIYHVNDALTAAGWRLNVLQRPPALHFCVTRPNTQPGVAEAFADDLTAAVRYAAGPPPAPPRSGAMYAAGATALGRGILVERIRDRIDALHELGPRG